MFSTNVFRVISLLLTMLGVCFYAKIVFSLRDQLPSIVVSEATIGVMAVSILLSVVNIGLGGLSWLRLLRDRNVSVRPAFAVSVFSISQIGKYIPGNIGQLVGRFYLARRAGLNAYVVLTTMMAENLWAAAVGAGMAAASISFFVDLNRVKLPPLLSQMMLVVIFMIFYASPWFAIQFYNNFLRRWLSSSRQLAVIPLPRFTTGIVVSTMYLIAFIIMGLILKLQAQWVFGTDAGSVLELSCLFAVAWLSGYLIPGAPAGLGIRESMMVLVLSPVIGTGTATALGITLRVTTTVGDAIAFVLGGLLRIISDKWANRSVTNANEGHKDRYANFK